MEATLLLVKDLVRRKIGSVSGSIYAIYNRQSLRVREVGVIIWYLGADIIGWRRRWR